MTEVYYNLSSTEAESGDTYAYTYKQMLLPHGIKIGDMVEIRIIDQTYIRLGTATNATFASQLSINGTNLSEIDSKNRKK